MKMEKEEDSRALAIQDQTWICHPDSKKDQGSSIAPNRVTGPFRGEYNPLN